MEHIGRLWKMQRELLAVASHRTAISPARKVFMAKIVCIGRPSEARHHGTYLKSLGHSFAAVGSVDEYLGSTRGEGADIVLVSETFDSGAKRSIAYWLRNATPNASIVYLFEHQIGVIAHADAAANVFDLDDVLAAVDSVLAAPRRANTGIATQRT
jgi:hypothetical protein